MTRDQIMALEGRELDAAVAEHVMGLAVQRLPVVPQDVDPDGLFDDEAARAYRAAYPSAAVVKPIPRYSTEIAAAWQVVEHIPWSLALDNVLGLWECTVMSLDGGETHDIYEMATAPTAPEAICKAALLAHLTDVCRDKNGGGQ